MVEEHRKVGRKSKADEAYLDSDLSPDSRKRKLHAFAQKRYRDRLKEAKQESYRSLRATQEAQLSGRQAQSILDPATLLALDNSDDAFPKSTTSSTARVVTTNTQLVSNNNDTVQGDLETVAALSEADRALFPELTHTPTILQHQPGVSTIPDLFEEDNTAFAPETPPSLHRIGRERSPRSARSTPSRSPSPAITEQRPVLDTNDEVVGFFRRHGFTSNRRPPPSPTESDHSITSDNAAPSKWPYGSQPAHKATTARGIPSGSNTTRRDQNTAHEFLVANNNFEEASQAAFATATTQRRPLQMLVQHFKRFQGCTAKQHKTALKSHFEQFASADLTHNRLRRITDIHSSLNVMSHETMLRAANTSSNRLTLSTLRRNLEGRVLLRDGLLSAPRNVCVHESELEANSNHRCDITSDVDSYCTWPIDLGAFRTGCDAYINPPVNQQMKSGLHIRREAGGNGVFDPEPEWALNLEKRAHICFGKVTNSGDTIYMYFPRLGNPTTLLSHDQLADFTDYLFLPALHRSCDSSALSQYPVSFQSALKKSKAGPIEGRVQGNEPQKTTSAITYHIDAKACSELWDNMMLLLADEDYEYRARILRFRGMHLFTSIKGQKYRFRSDELHTALDNFQSHLESTFNLEHLDNLLIDVGKEVTPTDTPVMTAFFREDCVKTALRGLFADAEGNPGSLEGLTVFNHCGTRDLTNFTAVPPPSCMLAQAGVIYAQMYSQIKQRFDAVKIYPFANEGLDTLVVGEERAKGHSAAGKTTVDFASLERNYCHSKNRVHEEVRKRATDVPHAAREEWRMFYAAFSEFREAAKQDSETLGYQQATQAARRTALTPLRCIDTREYLGFYWAVLDQRCSYFESIIASQNGRPEPAQAKLLLLLLETIRAFAIAANLPRRKSLWEVATASGTSQNPKIGAGFRHTMMEYGFCWLSPIVDYTKHTFLERYAHYMLFSEEAIFARYKANRADVQGFDDLSVAIHQMRHILSAWPNEHVSLYVLQLIVNFVMRQFRQDIRIAIEKDLQPDWRERIDEGNFQLCYKDIKKVYEGGIHLVGATRATKATTDPYWLLFRYFGELDQTHGATVERKHFHTRPYRILADLGSDVIRHPNFFPPFHEFLINGSVYYTYLVSACLDQHRMLPSIAGKCGNFTELAKENKAKGTPPQRQWIALRPVLDGKGATMYNPVSCKHYKFGGKPLTGPIQYPEETSFSLKSPNELIRQLVSWAETHFGRVHGIGRALSSAAADESDSED